VPVYFGAPHHAGDYVVLVKSFLLLPQAENPVVTVAWSLTSEVFFYGMFALIIYLPWRYTRALLIVLLLITAFFYLLKLLTAGTLQLPSHGGFVFSPYNLEFAMGCAAAYLVGRYRLRSGRRLTVIGVTIFLLCGLSEGFLHRHFGRHHSILGYGLSSMLVVWGAVLWEQGGRRAIPSLLLLPGDASYSIYLTHYALLDLLVRGSLALNIPGMIGPTLVIGMAIAVSLGIGVLFYLYIERPLLAQLRRRNEIRVNYPDVRPGAETLQEGL
jgi:peptidoglycan/LPS O-acetylase OafA/YrhL